MPRMNAGEVYRHLSRTGGWKELSDRIRWIAARYYSGVDSTLDHWTKKRYITGSTVMPPVITDREASMIIRYR